MISSKLDLSQVTLLTIETRIHDPARLAMQDCIDVADFGAVVVCGNKPYGLPNETFIECPDFDSLDGEKNSFSTYLWENLPRLFDTPYVIFMGYDSWIIDPEMWTDKFLEYDYIAAPSWHYDDAAVQPPWFVSTGHYVGGKGFCLISKRMLDHIDAHRNSYPHRSPIDYIWHTQYRSQMEAHGLRWAPESLAYQFSLERYRMSSDSRSFAFHDCFCWPLVLTRERLIERLALMEGYHWRKGKIQECLNVYGYEETRRLIQDVRCRRASMDRLMGPFEVLELPNPSIQIRD